MITFQEWKKDQNIDESFDVGLGISTPQSFASFGSFSDLLEARKKMKKKMDGDDSFGGKDKDDDMGDEDDDDHDEDDDDRDDDDMDDSDDDHDDDDDMGGDKKNRPDDDDDGDDNNPGVSDNPMMRMKKKMAKMKKKMQAEAKGFRDEDVIAEKKTEKTEEKCDCGKCDKCNPKKESFAQSLANMLNDQKPNTRFSSFGGYTDGQNSTFGEDAILPMIDPNTGLIIPSVADNTPVEPTAGQVGFAPQVRLGMF